MSEEEREEDDNRFYNVEKVKEVFASQSGGPPPSALQLLKNRVWRLLDSLSGLLTALIMISIIFGGFLAVIVGILFGPIVFLATTGSTIGLLAFYLNRKLGKSAQFGDSSLSQALIAQLVAMGLAIGLLLLLLNLGKLPLP